jgi:hypothetical protein
MAGRLHPFLPFGNGESATSYVSRLARFHGIVSALSFCTDMGLVFQKFADGEHGALSALAGLSGAPIAALLRGSLRRGDDGWRLNGERLTKPSLRRDRLHVCPKCLAADIGGQARPDVAVYGRAIWLVAHIRACPVHGVPLIEVANTLGARTHDFAAIVGPVAVVIADADAGDILPASAMEDYLVGRLSGAPRENPWLDALDFFAAAKTCEMVGAVALHGRTPNLKLLTEAQWREAGAAGFAIASGGEVSIRDFLRDLQATYAYTRSATEGPQAQFGRLYQWLAFGARDAAFDPVRDLMRRHILETMPVGPGDEIFGRQVERRVLHSVRSASLEFGVHPKRLRKLLAAKGLVADDHVTQPDDRVLFDIESASVVLQAAAGMSLKEVETYLNAGRVQAKLLVGGGFIRPVVAAGAPGIGENAFAKADLDAFLASLFADAVPVAAPDGAACDIPKAAKKANCSAAEIVRLILDRRLAWVGRLVGVAGYMSVLVDFEEIRRHVRGPALAGLTAQMVQQALRTTHKVVKALIGAGFLPRTRFVNPSNRCPVDLVSRADFEAFRAEYATLFELAEARGVHHLVLKAALAAKGVRPVVEMVGCGATFYMRTDL